MAHSTESRGFFGRLWNKATRKGHRTAARALESWRRAPRKRTDPLRLAMDRDRRSSPKRDFLFEPLEPRLLLSADPLLAYTAPDEADLLLRVDQDSDTPTLQLLEQSAASPTVVAQLLLSQSATGQIVITGSSLNDALEIDESVFELDSLVVLFDGREGSDTLAGPHADAPWAITLAGTGSLGNLTFAGVENLLGGAGEDTLGGPAEDTTWNLTGDGEGDVAGFAFKGFENLVGAADNEDTFVIGAAGAISGVVDGGDGGFDSMVVEDGGFQTIAYVATGPTSGSVIRDGEAIVFTGLEPVWVANGAADVVVDLSATSDDAVMIQSGTDIAIAAAPPQGPTFESVTFTTPMNSLTVNLGDDDGVFPNLDDFLADFPVLGDITFVQGDVLTISGTVDLGSAAFTVNGDDGLDKVVFDGDFDAGAIE